MTEEGFDLLPGEHAIVPVMFGDAVMAAKVADAMLHHGVFVTAFSYPVVPKGAARIRVQLSAAHSADDVEALRAGVRPAAAHGTVRRRHPLADGCGAPGRAATAPQPANRTDRATLALAGVQGWSHVSYITMS